MAATQLVNSFLEFAQEQIRQRGEELSIDDLYDDWRSRNQAVDDWPAIRASLNDMAQGERGEDFQDFATSFRQRNGL